MTLTQKVVLGALGAINCVWIFRHLVVTIIFRMQETLSLASPKFASANGASRHRDYPREGRAGDFGRVP